MKRRLFIKKAAVATGSTFAAGNLIAANQQSPDREIYELKIYQLTRSASLNILKNYYKDAIIPFLNNKNVRVGAFSEYSKDEPPRVYILHVYNNPADYWNVIHEMHLDKKYIKAANEYLTLPPAQLVYDRYDTLLMEAFAGLPQMKVPPSNRSLIELRIYESYNEDAFRRKVKMFNHEELPLFEKIGLNPLFFGELIAGKYLPALVYTLWFKDMEERDNKWNLFGASDEWKTMRIKEEYANTVSKVRRTFLTPLDFSQI